MSFPQNIHFIFATITILFITNICIAIEHREIKSNIANIRSGPGTEYSVIFQLKYGSLITVLDKNGDWLRIEGRNPQEIAWVYDPLTAQEGFTKRLNDNIQQQGANNEKLDLLPIINIIKVTSFASCLKYLIYGKQIDLIEMGGTVDEFIDLKTNKEIILDIDKYIADQNDGNDEYSFIMKNIENIKSIYNDLYFVKFISDDNFISPRFALLEDEKVFIITGILSEKQFNTINTSSRSRAAKIFESDIIPTLGKFYEKIFINSDIKNIGLSVTYGSKDFLDNYSTSMKAETLTFISTTRMCKEYFNGEITEDEFLDKSNIFLSDRDMVTKKIKLNIE